MWDTADPAALQEWLAENLGSDCRTELHEVRCALLHVFYWAKELAGLARKGVVAAAAVKEQKRDYASLQGEAMVLC
jgi:hypothetical protein